MNVTPRIRDTYVAGLPSHGDEMRQLRWRACTRQGAGGRPPHAGFAEGPTTLLGVGSSVSPERTLLRRDFKQPRAFPADYARSGGELRNEGLTAVSGFVRSFGDRRAG